MSYSKLSVFLCFLFLLNTPLCLGQTGKPESTTPVVWLGFPTVKWDAEQTRINLAEGKSFGSAFLKQLKRQALLIAARDELGALTRDAFLSESRQPEAILIEDIDEISINIGLSDQDRIVAEVDYQKFLSEMEKTSRNEMVRILEAKGLKKQAFPQSSELAELPQDTGKLLREYALIQQVEALRQIHYLIRTQGESFALLKSLVQGYTQLQLLTNVSIRDTHRVFQARAVLYAQRAVAKYGENEETLALRAAAWSLNNFPRIARSEFEFLQQAYPNTIDDPWVQIAKIYADFDVDGMKTLGETLDEEAFRPLAKLLCYMLLVDSGNGVTLARPYGYSIVGDLPECSRLYLNMFAHGVFYNPTGPDKTPFDEYLARRVPVAIARMQ